MRKFIKILRYARGQKRTVGIILALSVLGVAVAAAAPWPLKVLIDYAIEPAEPAGWVRSLDLSPMGWAVVAGLTAIALGLTEALINALVTWFWAGAGQSMVYGLTVALFERLQRLSLLFHRRADVGDLLNRLSADTYCVYEVTESLCVGPFRHLLSIVVLAAVAWWLDPVLTLILLGLAPALAGIAWFFGPRLRRVASQVRATRSALVGFVQQAIPAVPIVQVFTAEPRMLERYQTLGDRLVRETARGQILDSGYNSLHGLTTSIGLAAVVVIGGRDVLSGALSLGSLIVFMRYGRSLQASFLGLLKCYATLRKAEASVDRVVEVLASEETIRSPEHPRPMPPHTDGPRGGVAFEAVTFGYQSERPVLRDVDLTVEPGDSLAVVGATGAGKTTLTSLIPRLFDPWSGRVTVEGIDVRAVDLRELRSRVAVVPQQPFVMPLTVADNIRYGRPGATDAQVAEAARLADADGFIHAMPEGYATVLTDRGANLSTGQRQRLAIARAILIDASVVILDEPTSALDVDAETAVMDAMQRLTGRATWIVIAHRLSTARRARRIAVLDAGRVAELGTHEQLLALDGLYARYHRTQADHGGALD